MTLELRTAPEQMRDDLRAALEQRFTERAKVFEGGVYDGVRFVPWDDLLMAMFSAFDETPLPAPTSHAASVVTPARLVVGLTCPTCRELAPSAVVITSVLSVEGPSSEIKAKTSTKAVAHVCGQTALPLGVVEGQEEAFDIKDIVGDQEPPAEPPEDPGTKRKH